MADLRDALDPPTAETTLAVVLGAGKYPRKPAWTNQVLGASGRAVRDYLQSPTGLAMRSTQVLYLFDEPDGPQDQLGKIADFLSKSGAARDLIVYYVGHGCFDSNDYCLGISATERGKEFISTLESRKLARIIRDGFPRKRVYVILDSCFAASATRDWQGDGSTAAVQKMSQPLPREGTAFLAAVSKDDVARAPRDARYTVFTGAVLDALTSGVDRVQPHLSLRDVYEEVRERLGRQVSDSDAKPELHAPSQKEGDVSRLALFPNPAYARYRRRIEADNPHAVAVAPAPEHDSQVEQETVANRARREAEQARAEEAERAKAEAIEAARRRAARRAKAASYAASLWFALTACTALYTYLITFTSWHGRSWSVALGLIPLIPVTLAVTRRRDSREWWRFWRQPPGRLALAGVVLFALLWLPGLWLVAVENALQQPVTIADETITPRGWVSMTRDELASIDLRYCKTAPARTLGFDALVPRTHIRLSAPPWSPLTSEITRVEADTLRSEHKIIRDRIASAFDADCKLVEGPVTIEVADAGRVTIPFSWNLSKPGAHHLRLSPTGPTVLDGKEATLASDRGTLHCSANGAVDIEFADLLDLPAVAALEIDATSANLTSKWTGRAPGWYCHQGEISLELRITTVGPWMWSPPPKLGRAKIRLIELNGTPLDIEPRPGWEIRTGKLDSRSEKIPRKYNLKDGAQLIVAGDATTVAFLPTADLDRQLASNDQKWRITIGSNEVSISEVVARASFCWYTTGGIHGPCPGSQPKGCKSNKETRIKKDAEIPNDAGEDSKCKGKPLYKCEAAQCVP